MNLTWKNKDLLTNKYCMLESRGFTLKNHEKNPIHEIHPVARLAESLLIVIHFLNFEKGFPSKLSMFVKGQQPSQWSVKIRSTSRVQLLQSKYDLQS